MRVYIPYPAGYIYNISPLCEGLNRYFSTCTSSEHDIRIYIHSIPHIYLCIFPHQVISVPLFTQFKLQGAQAWPRSLRLVHHRPESSENKGENLIATKPAMIWLVIQDEIRFLEHISEDGTATHVQEFCKVSGWLSKNSISCKALPSFKGGKKKADQRRLGDVLVSASRFRTENIQRKTQQYFQICLSKDQWNQTGGPTLHDHENIPGSTRVRSTNHLDHEFHWGKQHLTVIHCCPLTKSYDSHDYLKYVFCTSSWASLNNNTITITATRTRTRTGTTTTTTTTTTTNNNNNNNNKNKNDLVLEQPSSLTGFQAE